MAEQSSQEKTEDATPKRLRDARKKGQVAKSRDLNTIFILIVAFGAIVMMKDYFNSNFQELMKFTFAGAVSGDLTEQKLYQYAINAFFSLAKTLSPYLAVVTIAAFAVGFLQVGAIFSTEPLKPSMKRLNAIENLKNMAKMTTLIELAKNIAKLSIIFFVAYTVLKINMREVMSTVTAPPIYSTLIAAKVITSFLIKVFIVFVMIAIIDVMVQRWQYKKQMKMSKEEVKREYKQDEGDPLIKSMRRQIHQELAMSDVRHQVKQSDVIVTNPTEVAVAIRYDDKTMMAPQIMAKGQRLFAEMIRDLAKEFNVPVMQNMPLAWALLELEIGDEVPEELYAAVAELLVIVYRMRGESV